MYTIDVPTGIGPSFASELKIAGLEGLPIVWATTYVQYENTGPNSLSPAEITALEGVISAHNPNDPIPPDENDLMRQAVVAYAELIKPMSDAQRKQQTATPEFEGFLDNIIELGPEGF